MPRIRSLKPEFFDSPSTITAELRTRLLFMAMWCWADDYGIGDATPVRLIGFAFPGDDIPASDYPRLLADVSSAYGVIYFRHSGRPFYVIPSWENHQRTEKKAKPKQTLIAAASAAMNATAAAAGVKDSAGQDEESEPSEEGEGFSDAFLGRSEEPHGPSGAGTGEQGKGEVGKEVLASVTNVSTERARENSDEPPRGPVVDADGWRLIRAEIPIEHPSAVRTDLAQRAGALLKAGTPESDVRAALGLWLTKPTLGPGVLPSLVSEVVRNRNRPAATMPLGGSTADQRVAQAQAVKAMFVEAEQRALEQ